MPPLFILGCLAMKVEALIKRLQKMNPDAVVHLHHKDGDEVLFIMAQQNDNSVVWLETEDDNDMGQEIQVRFDAIDHGEVDEQTMYAEMLSLGITVDMVRKYTGDDNADRMERALGMQDMLVF